ncbi:hypothetical protein AGMMS49521_2280 [Campylobacterota bacterium]|nr:hypothetical protein AGMMS49521_2280 [Campylobacterota bacterium]
MKVNKYISETATNRVLAINWFSDIGCAFNMPSLETGNRTGTDPNGGIHTKVRVHVNSQGEIHGHPSGKEIFS